MSETQPTVKTSPNDEVVCPACRGCGAKDCCDNEGFVQRWVAEAMAKGQI